MTNDRMAGLALIAGSAGVIVTLTLHPSGRELFEPGTFDSAARTLVAVHSLALCSLPVWFLGASGLSRRLSSPGGSSAQFSFAGLVLYGFAMTAMLITVVMDGLVIPGLAHQIINTTGTVGQGWRIAFNLNGILTQAFEHVFVVASSAAIMVWSVSIIRSRALARGLGIYGCLLAVGTVVTLLSGQLDRQAHLFALVIVGQTIWLIAAGALLFRPLAPVVLSDTGSLEK
jgi:hypothetical protein